MLCCVILLTLPSSNIGKKFDKSRLVQKVLYSLYECFQVKVTVIEESKDIETFNLDKLVRSIQTFEINLQTPKKSCFQNHKG